jgi:hypothetical protein
MRLLVIDVSSVVPYGTRVNKETEKCQDQLEMSQSLAIPICSQVRNMGFGNYFVSAGGFRYSVRKGASGKWLEVVASLETSTQP